MALTRITKGVIKPNENYDTHNINSTGIVTAIGLDVNGNGDISGNLSVGGVLTYEDVTSIDSVGIITARGGIDCNGDLDVDGHTNLDNVSIAGITTVDGGFIFDNGTNAGKDLQWQPSNNRLAFFNDVKATFGNTVDLQLYHSSNENHIYGSTNKPIIFSTNTDERLRIDSSGHVMIGTTTEGQANADEFTISFNNTGVPNGDQGRCGMTIRSGSNTSSVEQDGYIYFSNGTSGDNEYKGTIVYEHDNDALKFGTNGGAERLRITSTGQVSISGAGTTFGVAKLNIAPANRTSAFSASDGDTWHDVVIKQSASATTNSVGIAFEISPSAYHKNAGTGIVAIKDGNNFDYGTHLAFITRPHTAVAEERLRITSAGQVQINRDGGSAALTLGASQDFRLYHDAGGPTIFSDNNNQGLKLQIKELNLTEYTGATSRLKILSNGNVEVKASGADQKRSIKIEGTNGSSELQGVVLESDGENAKFHIKTGAGGGTPANKLTIQTITGKVGIGTDNPEKNLDIYTGRSHSSLRLHNLNNGGTGYDSELSLLGSASNSEMRINMGVNSDPDREQIKSYQSNLIFKTATEERLRITSTGEVRIPSGSNSTNRLTLGGAIDIYHDGNTKFENSTGYLKLMSANKLYIDGDELFFRNEGGTNRWRILTTGHFVPGAAGTYNIGSTTAEVGDVYIADDKKLQIGSSQDLQIYHTTSGTSWIRHTNSSEYFILEGNQMDFRDYASGVYRARMGTAVQLYYNGNNVKLSTTNTGIDVTGEVATSQDYPNIRPTLDLNFAAEKKLDPRITYRRTGPASFVNEFGKVVLVGGNVPRFDHDPTTRESKGLLIEESRTNIYKNNHNLQTTNDHGGVTQTVNTTETTAPDGTFTATKIDITGGDQWTRFDSNNGLDNSTINNSDTFSTSIYMKTVGTSNVNVAIDFGDGGNTTYSVGQEWKRYAISNVHNDYGSFRFVDLVLQGDIYIWGLQVEKGAFATSFIPTYGGTVTRGEDLAEIDGEDFTDFFNQTEGTINCAYWLGNDNVGTRICQISASNYSVLDIVSGSGSGSGGYGYVYTNGAAQANGGQSSVNANYLNKLHVVTLAYKENDIAGINRNTGVVTNDTSATLHGGYDQLNFYQRQGDGNQLNGHLQRVQYYPKRLPDNQLKNINNQ